MLCRVLKQFGFNPAIALWRSPPLREIRCKGGVRASAKPTSVWCMTRENE